MIRYAHGSGQPVVICILLTPCGKWHNDNFPLTKGCQQPWHCAKFKKGWFCKVTTPKRPVPHFGHVPGVPGTPGPRHSLAAVKHKATLQSSQSPHNYQRQTQPDQQQCYACQASLQMHERHKDQRRTASAPAAVHLLPKEVQI